MAQIRKFNGGGGITIGTRKYSYDEINEYLDKYKPYDVISSMDIEGKKTKFNRLKDGWEYGKKKWKPSV